MPWGLPTSVAILATSLLVATPQLVGSEKSARIRSRRSAARLAPGRGSSLTSRKASSIEITSTSGAEFAQHVLDLLGHPDVQRVPRPHHLERRHQSQRPGGGHCRAHSELPGGIRSRGDHAAAARVTSHHERGPTQQGVVELLYGAEESIQIDMQDGARLLHPRLTLRVGTLQSGGGLGGGHIASLHGLPGTISRHRCGLRALRCGSVGPFLDGGRPATTARQPAGQPGATDRRRRRLPGLPGGGRRVHQGSGPRLAGAGLLARFGLPLLRPAGAGRNLPLIERLQVEHEAARLFHVAHVSGGLGLAQGLQDPSDPGSFGHVPQRHHVFAAQQGRWIDLLIA